VWVAEFMVEKRICGDRDAAFKQIIKILKLNERTGKLNKDHFEKIFTRPLFKESLVEVLADI
jgi:hypothetical protein